jgi:hypothetical protein
MQHHSQRLSLSSSRAAVMGDADAQEDCSDQTASMIQIS